MNKKKPKLRFSVHLLVVAVLIFASIVVMPADGFAALSTILFPYAVSEDGSTTLILYRHNPTDNMVFNAENMFPGDTITQEYCVRVACENDITMQFSIDVHEGYEKLAEVLYCKVVFLDTGEVLYDGLMFDATNTFDHDVAGGDDTVDLKYEITVSLDTSVGNEYQNQKLMADFVWHAEGELEIIEPPDIPLSPSPGTGDMFRLEVWVTLMVSSVVAFVWLVAKKRKDDQNA